MTHIKDDKQLAYFLQGHFEITGTTDLTRKQANKIVFTVLSMEETGPTAKMVLSHLKLNEDLKIISDLDEAGKKISAELNALFQHDIDPSYEGDQTTFQDIHDGKDSGPLFPPSIGSEPIMRC